jgi:hypothetical protein
VSRHHAYSAPIPAALVLSTTTYAPPMALPSRDQTFAYENCRDLLEKLDREIERYRDVAGTELGEMGERLLRLVDQLKDSAFNASVTAWHIFVTGCLTIFPKNNVKSWALRNLSTCKRM